MDIRTSLFLLFASAVIAILSPAQYQQWQSIRQQEIREMMEKKGAQ